MSKSVALQRLQAAITTAVVVAFWRRYIRGLELPALLSPDISLASRWSARKLKGAFAALSPSLGGSALATPESERPLSLSRTWSPYRLGHFFATFRAKELANASTNDNDDCQLAGSPPRPTFSSWCQFMEDSLHHPAWGYYCDGRVEFGEAADTSDFTTFPVSMRPAFGAMLADRLHALWLASVAGVASSARATGDAGGAAGVDPFLVLELGAGTGVLAHDILSHCEKALPQLYAAMCYVIGERSHALREVQEGTNARFVGAGKLRVVPADARDEL